MTKINDGSVLKRNTSFDEVAELHFRCTVLLKKSGYIKRSASEVSYS